MGILYDQYSKAVWGGTDKSVKPPNCPNYQNGYCNYYECACDSVNFKCEWEERKTTNERKRKINF